MIPPPAAESGYAIARMASMSWQGWLCPGNWLTERIVAVCEANG